MSWQEHVKRTRMAHPGLSFKEALQEASKTYKRSPQKTRKTRKMSPTSGRWPPALAGSPGSDRRSPVGDRFQGAGVEHVKASQLVYNKPNERANYGDYRYMGGDAEKGYWKSPRNIIIAFRGTVSKEDVKTDLALAAGALHKTSRYKRDLTFVKKIMSRATSPVILTGHSLGGAIATDIGRSLGVPAYVYNPGAGLGEKLRGKIDKAACLVRKKGKRCKKASLIKTERTVGDPVSFLGRKGVNVKHIIPKKLNVHSIDNFSTGNL